jgi:hypothetical protein
LGNQRSFYVFIVALFIAVLYFYYVVTLYAVDYVIPTWSHGLDNIASIFTKFSWGPEVLPLIVLITASFDLIWVAFVGALVARHTAYMSVNVTTYEVLVRPPHVVRRFPKNRGRFWFLSAFGIIDCFRNWGSYWTLNMDYDASDFLGAAPPDSFVAGGAMEPLQDEKYMHAAQRPGVNVAPAPMY